MITHGIRTLFLAQSAITSLAPAQTIGRVSFPSVFCDNAVEGVKPPFIVLKYKGTDPLVTLDSTYNESLKAVEIDIDVYGYSLPSARTLSNIVRQFFDDYQGIQADGATQGTATVIDSTYGLLSVVGGADGTKGVKLPAFTGSFQVANASPTQTLKVYPESGGTINAGSANAAYTLAAGSIGTFVYSSALTYTATASTTNAPSDVIRAVTWQDETYDYLYPTDGLDTKFHVMTTGYLIHSEQCA